MRSRVWGRQGPLRGVCTPRPVLACQLPPWGTPLPACLPRAASPSQWQLLPRKQPFPGLPHGAHPHRCRGPKGPSLPLAWLWGGGEGGAGEGGGGPWPGLDGTSSCLTTPFPTPFSPNPQVYMNAVWRGWAIPMFLFLAILRLSLNYLIARWVSWPLSCAHGSAASPAVMARAEPAPHTGISDVGVVLIGPSLLAGASMCSPSEGQRVPAQGPSSPSSSVVTSQRWGCWWGCPSLPDAPSPRALAGSTCDVGPLWSPTAPARLWGAVGKPLSLGLPGSV